MKEIKAFSDSFLVKCMKMSEQNKEKILCFLCVCVCVRACHPEPL